MVRIRRLHWDWVPPGPLGPNTNLAEAGGLNFAAGGNGWLSDHQFKLELPERKINKTIKNTLKSKLCEGILVKGSDTKTSHFTGCFGATKGTSSLASKMESLKWRQ